MEDFRLIYDFQAGTLPLIGAMLIAPEKVIPEAALSLSPNCFYHGLCRQVYSTCIEYFKLGKPVDPITVSAESGGSTVRNAGISALPAPAIPRQFPIIWNISGSKRNPYKNDALAAAEALIDEIQKEKMLNAASQQPPAC